MMEAPEKKPKFLPIWIWAIVLLEMITPVYFGVLAHIDIQIMNPDQAGPSFLSSMYVVRNIAVGLAVGAAAFLFRSYRALFILIIVRMSMETSDFYNSYRFERSQDVLDSIPPGIVLYLVIPAIALFVLWPRVKAEKTQPGF